VTALKDSGLRPAQPNHPKGSLPMQDALQTAKHLKALTGTSELKDPLF